MTTIFGIKNQELNAAILVADKQSTANNPHTGIPIGKYINRKLHVSDDGLFCFGMAGLYDQHTHELVKKLKENKYNIQEIIEKGDFEILRNLNINRIDRQLPDYNRMTGFLMATRFDNTPKLYNCYPFGKVAEGYLVPIGSGEQKLNEYINSSIIMGEAKNYMNPDTEPKIENMITYGLEAVRRSQNQDMFSQGLDLLVITPEKINDHFKDLDDPFKSQLDSIVKKYKK